MLSTEYIGAIALVIVSVLHAFGINVANDAVSGILSGAIALWIAYRRHQRGDISLGGVKKA